MAVTALTDTVAFSPAAVAAAVHGPEKRRRMGRARRKIRATARAAISREGTSSSVVIRTVPSMDLNGPIYENLK
jgi:hypothetical protein